jgi:hypothetical protein
VALGQIANTEWRSYRRPQILDAIQDRAARADAENQGEDCAAEYPPGETSLLQAIPQTAEAISDSHFSSGAH